MRIRLNHKRLLQLLAESKLSQNHWAIKLGLSKGHWSQVVNGKHPYPSQKTRQLLLEALGVPFEELFLQESQPGVEADFQSAIADRYLLDKEIGHGGMGTVYLARDVKHGRSVAIKVVSEEAVSGIGVDLFLKEIRYTARLEHHHILPLYDSGHAAGQPFYVMPYVRGGSLRALLNRESRLSVDRAFGIAGGVAAALQHAHDRQVLHCDVKPENILLSDDHPYVADFGISRAIHTEVFEWGKRREIDSSAGTPAYVSPEQATGEQNLDARSDVYSLGCMVFEMLSGEKPFAGTNTMQVVSRRFSEAVPNVRERSPHVPAPVASAVKRAMELDPERRTRTAAEFSTDLAQSASRKRNAVQQAVGNATTAAWSLGRKALGLDGRTRRRALIESIWQDVRYVARSLSRKPAFTTAAVGTLALGIGAITAIFSIVNAVLFRPLDYPDPGRLAVMDFHAVDAESRANWASFNESVASHRRRSITYPNFERWQDVTGDIFEHLGVYDDGWTYDVNFGGGTERLPGAIVSAGVFGALGVPPELGRWFIPEEDEPGSAPAIILSYGLWQRRLGGGDDVIGKTVRVREEPRTIVGVMPRGFGFPSPTVQFWVPMANATRGPRSWNYEVIGRVPRSSGMDLAAAQLEARTVVEQAGDERESEFGATLSILQDRIVGDARPLLLIFLAAVGVVLLIACVNVVNLMLTRASAQEHEHTVRTALGAGPRRLAQQLFTESTAVSVLGALLGFLLAIGLIEVLIALAPESIPRREEIGVDWIVFGFTLAVALLVGLGIGLVPALRALKIDLVSRLADGPRGSSSGERQGRIRDGLVVAQLGLALVLLVSAGLLVRSFAGLLGEETGFEGRNVMTFETSLPQSRYTSFAERRLFYDELLDNLRTMPGVQAAALVVYLPASGWFHSNSYEVEGYAHGPAEELSAETKEISPDYFDAMGMSLLEGRAFNGYDDESAPKVVVVNESMARRYWGRGDAQGKRIKLSDEWHSVVGVVNDVRYRAARFDTPKVYRPYAAGSRGGSMDVVLRVQDRPRDLAPAIRQLLTSLDPEVTLYGVQPLEDILWRAVAAPRFRTMLLISFGALSLLLSLVGVYGVMAYSVAQRTRELGIRLALGAEYRDVLWSVASRGILLTLLGISLGFMGAYAAVGVLQSYLYNLTPQDPLTFVAAAVVLGLASLTACLVPALRATKVDPLIALRAE